MFKPRVKLKPPPAKTNLIELRISEPNPKLMAALKSIVERAETGELQGFVGCFLFDNGKVDDAWIETPAQWHTSVVSDRITGSLFRLTHKLMAIRTRAETDRFVYFEDDP